MTLLYLSQYDGTMALNSLPQTQTFDLMNHKSSIIPGCRFASTTALNHASSDEVGQLTLASISHILSSFASIIQTQSSHRLPTILTHSPSQDPIASSIVFSLVINTPSKLCRFLEYAKTHLGVPDARLYKRCLKEMGYALTSYILSMIVVSRTLGSKWVMSFTLSRIPYSG